MEHQHEFQEVGIVTTFTIQFAKVEACPCGQVRTLSQDSTEWDYL